jgi:hypothetical protein
VRIVLVVLVHGNFRRWQPEDYVSTARINVREFENVTEKSTIRIRICAEDNSMGTNKHEISPSVAAKTLNAWRERFSCQYFVSSHPLICAR